MTQDPLGDLSMKPARDEVVQRQQSRGGKQPVRQPNQPAPKSRPPARSGSGATGSLWSIVVLMLIIIGAGGWYLWNKIETLQASLAQSTQALATSEQALSGLQQTQAQLDKSLNRTGDQMAADIKALENEVRKLWDVANKRNKTAIDANAAAIAKLQADLKAQSAALEKQSTAIDKKVATAVDAASGVKADIAALQESSKTLDSLLEKQKAELARLKTEVAAGPGDLEDRITNLEVSLKSIDVYRKQVNGRLDQLDQQLGQVYKQTITP